MNRLPPAIAPLLALSLAACSPASQPSAERDETKPTPTSGADETKPTPTSVAVVAAPPAAASPHPAVLGLEGLGPLKIGRPVPEGWGEHGAQASDTCRVVTSPDYPGVYAIVTGGTVKRITLGPRSTVKLAEGIGVGATERQVLGWFGGFRATPHKYVAAPGKYLTAPNAASGDPALRFEIGADRRVTAIHVGTMPELGFVEGCS